jgi:hypothetical protein
MFTENKIVVKRGFLKMKGKARRQWLTPVILATQEAEVRRILVRSQIGQ